MGLCLTVNVTVVDSIRTLGNELFNIFHSLTLVMRQDAAFNSDSQHAMSRKFTEK